MGGAIIADRKAERSRYGGADLTEDLAIAGEDLKPENGEKKKNERTLGKISLS